MDILTTSPSLWGLHCLESLRSKIKNYHPKTYEILIFYHSALGLHVNVMLVSRL